MNATVISNESEPRPVKIHHSDLVRDSKLEAICSGDYTIHTFYTYGGSARRRRERQEQTWMRDGPKALLGKGAHGEVYRERCGRRFRAVKIISEKVITVEKLDYVRELEAAAKFSHPKYRHCFVQSYGWFEREGSICIAMEYLQYGNLESYLAGPVPEHEVRSLIMQVLEGIKYMHDNGFVHRDLKPKNILVVTPGSEWCVKIADFGISKRTQQGFFDGDTLSIGTLAYTAPELLQFDCWMDLNSGESAGFTFAVDMWSLGALTFTMITNTIAFPGILDLQRYIRGKYKSKDSPLDRLRAKGISEQCQDFIIRLMKPESKDRLQANAASHHPWMATVLNSSVASSTKNRPTSLPLSADLNGRNLTPSVISTSGADMICVPRSTMVNPVCNQSQNLSTEKIMLHPSINISKPSAIWTSDGDTITLKRSVSDLAQNDTFPISTIGQKDSTLNHTSSNKTNISVLPTLSPLTALAEMVRREGRYLHPASNMSKCPRVSQAGPLPKSQNESIGPTAPKIKSIKPIIRVLPSDSGSRHDPQPILGNQLPGKAKSNQSLLLEYFQNFRPQLESHSFASDTRHKADFSPKPITTPSPVANLAASSYEAVPQLTSKTVEFQTEVLGQFEDTDSSESEVSWNEFHHPWETRAVINGDLIGVLPKIQAESASAPSHESDLVTTRQRSSRRHNKNSIKSRSRPSSRKNIENQEHLGLGLQSSNPIATRANVSDFLRTKGDISVQQVKFTVQSQEMDKNCNATLIGMGKLGMDFLTRSAKLASQDSLLENTCREGARLHPCRARSPLCPQKDYKFF